MSRWFRRPPPEPSPIVEQVEPVEIPVITEVKRRLGRGDYRGAVRFSYPRAVNDLARAFSVPFAAGSTHEEFLRSLTNPEMGHLPEFFRQFYQLYSPLRYGPVGTPIRYGSPTSPEAPTILSLADAPGVLSGLLQSIYAQRPMWQLYLELKVPPKGETPSAKPPEVGGALAPAEVKP